MIEEKEKASGLGRLLLFFWSQPQVVVTLCVHDPISLKFQVRRKELQEEGGRP